MTLRELWIDFGGHASNFIEARNEVTGHVDRLPDSWISKDGTTLNLDDYKDSFILENLAFDLNQKIEIVNPPSDTIRIRDVKGVPFQMKFYYSKPKIWNLPVDGDEQSANVSAS